MEKAFFFIIMNFNLLHKDSLCQYKLNYLVEIVQVVPDNKLKRRRSSLHKSTDRRKKRWSEKLRWAKNITHCFPLVFARKHYIKYSSFIWLFHRNIHWLLRKKNQYSRCTLCLVNMLFYAFTTSIIRAWTHNIHVFFHPIAAVNTQIHVSLSIAIYVLNFIY